MKIEAKKFGKYSMHLILPKKECPSIKEGDLIEVGIDGKTTTAPQFDPSAIERRLEMLEGYFRALQEEKKIDTAAKKAEKLRIANQQADDGEGFG